MSAQADPPKRPSKNAAIWIRLIVSPITLIVLVGILYLHDRTGSAWPTNILLFLAAAGAAYEVAQMFRVGGMDAAPVFAAVASGLVAAVGLFAPDSAALRMELRVLLPLLALVVLLCVRLLDLRPGAAAGIAATILPVLYVGVPLSFAVDLGDGAHLARWLVYVLVVAKASDIGGWLAGKPFGKHKLIPAISPGKSWEGLAGGLLLSVIAAVALPGLLGISAAAWSVPRQVLFGLVLGLASVLAGLMHSGWKRRFGVKDSGSLIPEIGGFLDMVDSMLLAVPVAWIWFRLGLG
jgi:phosphatidate cytidylyltransferase